MSQKPSSHKPPKKHAYAALTPALAFQLAAPHTWAAALMPVLLSYVYCTITFSGRLSILYGLVLLAICLLMQSAVNILNDYFDFKKGVDSKQNSSDDAFDAVLVYHDLNPRSVLALAVFFLVIAAALGLYLVAMVGWPLLVIGIIGAVIVVLYSGGKTPISYLPIGEAVSGIVMGGLIPLACCYALTGILQPLVLLVSLPCIIGIGMILFTNNTCDVAKDRVAHRKTISVVLGHERAVRAYRATVLVWAVVIVALVGIFYSAGMPIVLVMFLTAFPTLRALINNPLIPASRDGAMAQISQLNVVFGTFYCLALAAGSFISWV